MTGTSSEPEVEFHVEDERLKEQVIEALRTVFDPEIPINIYDLGLVYRLDVGNDGRVTVFMTLTSPGSHLSYIMPERVEKAVRRVSGVISCEVTLVWDPPWTTDRVSRSVREQLDMPIAEADGKEEDR